MRAVPLRTCSTRGHRQSTSSPWSNVMSGGYTGLPSIAHDELVPRSRTRSSWSMRIWLQETNFLRIITTTPSPV